MRLFCRLLMVCLSLTIFSACTSAPIARSCEPIPEHAIQACQRWCSYTAVGEPEPGATAEEIVIHATSVFERARQCQIGCAALVQHIRAREPVEK